MNKIDAVDVVDVVSAVDAAVQCARWVVL